MQVNRALTRMERQTRPFLEYVACIYFLRRVRGVRGERREVVCGDFYYFINL
jgi:hypothetical protein